MHSTPALRDFFNPVDPAEIADAAMKDHRLFRKTKFARTHLHACCRGSG